jgi:hypothetical protein
MKNPRYIRAWSELMMIPMVSRSGFSIRSRQLFPSIINIDTLSTDVSESSLRTRKQLVVFHDRIMIFPPSPSREVIKIYGDKTFLIV